jgi:hypothetical protein
LRSDRRHVVGRFAAHEQANQREKDRHIIHFKIRFQKSCGLAHRAHQQCLLLAPERSR